VPVTRVAIIDPQPALRAGLAVLLRAEPGLVPVTDTVDADVVLLDHTLVPEGLSLCRSLSARVILYSTDEDPALPVLARVAGACGVVDKTASPEVLFEAIRRVGRGGETLPPVTPRALETAGERVAPEDLAIIAMLVDGTEPHEVADVLRIGRVGATRRFERVLARLAA
jgi:DNA-binding NarL/FixJ family response regulator